MPSVQDVIEMTDLLRVKSVVVDEDRCVRVRNRNAKCSKCMDACITGAIEVSMNEISIDPSTCVGCGVCYPVCPDNALFTADPSASKVVSDTCKKGDETAGLAVIACARRASKHQASPDDFCEVPCLGFIGESELLDCAASGFGDIVLVDGNCETCKYGKASSYIDMAVDTANALLESTDVEAIVSRTSEFPPEVAEAFKGNHNLRGEDRRGILFQTGSYVKTVAGNVAKKTIEEKLGIDSGPKTLKQRLGATATGRMPSFTPVQNFSILENMEALALKAGHTVDELADDDSAIGSTVLDTRHFGTISVDAEKCSGCGMCVLFCPTEALSYSEFDEPEDPELRYVELDSSLCTQCRLCEEVCLRKCLEVSSKVTLSDLFDMEPTLIAISKPQNKTSLFDLSRNRSRITG